MINIFPKNKKGEAGVGVFLNLFIFIIVALIVTFIGVTFVYMIGVVKTEMHNSLDNMTEANSSTNFTELIDDNIGDVESAYGTLYWIAVFLIIGMLSAIFIGSYMVTFRPVIFVPYIIIVLVGVVVGAGISNGYELVMVDENLSPTFNSFLGASFILLHLPIWVAVIGIVGGIIMVLRMKEAEGRF